MQQIDNLLHVVLRLNIVSYKKVRENLKLLSTDILKSGARARTIDLVQIYSNENHLPHILKIVACANMFNRFPMLSLTERSGVTNFILFVSNVVSHPFFLHHAADSFFQQSW